MSDPFMLAIGLLTHLKASPPAAKPNPPKELGAGFVEATEPVLCQSPIALPSVSRVENSEPEFSPVGRNPSASWLDRQLFEGLPSESFRPRDAAGIAAHAWEVFADTSVADPVTYLPTAQSRPLSGPQMYQQRLAALRSGQTYTRIAVDSFASWWRDATDQPTYEQWKGLLASEARAIARGKGANRLAILLGDSISMWFPQERLPKGPLWLNQGISGDTSRGILSRLSALSATQPDTIYLLAGINDLRRGARDDEILWNHRQIVRRLREDHPQAEIIVQSILPTRLGTISNQRIRRLNREIAAIAQQEGAIYLDMHSQFIDPAGALRPELTTDGLHLNRQGYEIWRSALLRSQSWKVLSDS